MKHNSFFALGLIGLLTLAITGCNGFEEQKIPEPITKGSFVIMVGTETKTEMDDYNKIVWSENDKLSVFVTSQGVSSGNLEFTYDSEDPTKKKFTGDIPGDLPGVNNDWYVLYPYNSAITTPANTSAAINIGCDAGGYQYQSGNDNLAHLTGPHFPLYGKADNVSAAQVPDITLKQALSVLRVHVTNKTTESLTVNEVSFTGTEGIAGSFYINFAGESAVFTAVEGATSNTATLKVSNGTAIPAGDTANFYLAIKPFTAPKNFTLTLSVNGFEKTITLDKAAVEFKPGLIKTLNFNTPDNQDVFPPLLENWEVVNDITTLPENETIVIVDAASGKALANNSGSSNPSMVSIDFNDVSDDVKWIFEKSSDGNYMFRVPETTTKASGTANYLYCEKDGTTVVRVGNGDNNKFQYVLIENKGYYLHCVSFDNARYICTYPSGSDWRYYAAASVSGSGTTIYKKVSAYAGSYDITIDSDIIGGIVTAVPADKQYEGSTVSLTAEPTTGIFTSWDVYKTDDSSVKVTVENDQFVMPGYPVTVSAVFGAASLEVSEITPSVAPFTAGSVTFTVASNVEWMASSEDDFITVYPSGAQAPSADPVTVTVTFEANDESTTRDATVNVDPTNSAYIALAKDVIITQEAFKIIDVLNNAWTGIDGSTYSAVENLNGSASDAVYSVQAAGDNSSIQLRSKNNNSGIVTTTSGGLVKKITVDWNSNTASGRTVDVYGKNTAYTNPTDLYDSDKQGTKLGSIICGSSTELTVTEGYEYVGIRSSDGALYLDEIDIEWKVPNWNLESIFIDTEPEKTTYEVGESFDPTGMVVKAHYVDSDDNNITKDEVIDNAALSFSPSTLVLETTSVTISYSGKSATQEITVNAPVVWELASIAVTTPPTKTTYTEGDYFDPTGMVVKATYEQQGLSSNTKTETINHEDLSFNPSTTTALTTANTSVTITYNEKSTTQNITVNAVVHYQKVTSLANVTAGEYIIVNAGYYLPNADATSGGPAKVAVTISNDEVQDVNSAMTWTFTGTTSAMIIQSTADATKYLIVSGNGNGNIRVNTTSNHTWTIADYSGTSGAFTMMDNTLNRYCATYGAGSDWRSYNTYNAGNYADGGRVYLYKLADNTVWDLKSIAVKTAPGKTSYEAGEDFNPAGLVLTATYEDHDGVKDDKTVEVTYSDGNASQFGFSPSTALTAGTTSVTISYTDSGITKSTTQAITVTAPIDWTLSSIAVKTEPTKTTYNVDDYFDPTGLVITATYTAAGQSNKTEDVAYAGHTSEFTFSPTTSTKLTTANTSVTITWGGKSTTQAIEVNSSITTTSYTKVTSAPSSWAGTYILVYEESSTSGRVCTAGVDAASNYVTATIASGVITSNDLSDCEVEIATYSTGYSVKALGGTNANKYLEGKGSSSNGTTFAASASKVTTLSISNGVVTITNNTNVFAYNSAANNLRWRFFKSGTAAGNGYYKPALYKKN